MFFMCYVNIVRSHSELGKINSMNKERTIIQNDSRLIHRSTYAMVKLTILRLNHNQIDDISSLQNLTLLTSLHLNNNQISDISWLMYMTNLTYLNLSNNLISDIWVLRDLINLVKLYLTGNNTILCVALDELEQILSSTTIYRPSTCIG